MAEREITIKISAKNLTEAEFKKARKGLAGLGKGSDETRGKTSSLQRAFTSFGKAAPAALRIVTGAAAAAGAAIGGVTIAVIKLGERGAVVADVRDAFDRLSMSAGETGAVMLGELQRGVKGTVTNFELMKLANIALGAGLLDTAEEARTLAEGARLLAKRTGGDTAQAFTILTTAMASGRTAQLKQIGLFVDNKKAVEEFAKAQGRSLTSLTDVDRATALQAATLQALRVELANNAPPLADFGELIEQGKVSVKNLVDGLAVMISQSPPLLAGMGAIRDVIGRAFGADQQSMILGIVNAIERAALIAIEFGKAGIGAAGIVYRGFASIKLIILGSASAFTILASTTANAVASIVEVIATIPGASKELKGLATFARDCADSIEGVNSNLLQQVTDTALAAAGNDAFGMSLDILRTGLDTVKTSVVNAGLSQGELNRVTAEGAQQNVNLANSYAGVATLIPTVFPILDEWRAKLIQDGLDTTAYGDTVSAIFQQNKTDAEIYGVEVNGLAALVAANTGAMAEAFKAFGIKTRLEMELTVKRLEEHYNAIKESGLTTAKELEEAERKLHEARRQMSGDTRDITINQTADLASSVAGQFAQLGGKFKIFAIAEAIISTYLAAAKSLAMYGWPMGLVAMAGAIVAGLATVLKIKAQSFQAGTAGLDYADFGTSTQAVLHGREAVIPEGGGNRLADEIAGALARKRPTREGDVLAERFEQIGSKLDDLPSAIQRAVRDGMLLAT